MKFRSQQPRSAAVRLLRLCVRTPRGGMHICCEYGVLSEVSASGWSLVKRGPTECGVSEWDLVASWLRRSWPPLDRSAIKKICTWNQDIPSFAPQQGVSYTFVQKSLRVPKTSKWILYWFLKVPRQPSLIDITRGCEACRELQTTFWKVCRTETKTNLP